MTRLLLRLSVLGVAPSRVRRDFIGGGTELSPRRRCDVGDRAARKPPRSEPAPSDAKRPADPVGSFITPRSTGVKREIHDNYGQCGRRRSSNVARHATMPTLSYTNPRPRHRWEAARLSHLPSDSVDAVSGE
jgi:hypothetical protein